MTRGGDIDNMKASRLKTPIQEFVADIDYLYERAKIFKLLKIKPKNVGTLCCL